MGNMPTHCETNSFSSTTAHSIEPSTKASSNSDSFMSSEPSSQNGFPLKSLNCSKVGLGILNLVAEETKTNSVGEDSDESSKCNNMVLGPQLKIDVSSSSRTSTHLNESFLLIRKEEKNLLTRDNKIYRENRDLNESFGGSDGNAKMNSSDHDEIGGNLETSLGFKPTSFLPKPSYEIPVAITASEILLSEDYTRVTCYGPNPKITHIFYGFSLECHPNQLVISFGQERELVSVVHHVATYPSGSSSYHSSHEFMSFCDACNKTLNGWEDHIYIYRGDSSFCSHECLAVGILAEEITKAANKKYSGDDSNDDDHDGVVFLMDESPLPAYPNGQ